MTKFSLALALRRVCKTLKTNTVGDDPFAYGIFERELVLSTTLYTLHIYIYIYIFVLYSYLYTYIYDYVYKQLYM